MQNHPPGNKTYLGDAVYAEYDGYVLRLNTATETIYLEPDVMKNLLMFYETETSRYRIGINNEPKNET